MPDQPTPPPQNIRLYRRTDNTVTVTMTESGSIAGMTFVAEITDAAGTVLATKTVSVSEPGSASVAAVFSFVVSPDLDSLARGGLYEYVVRRTDTGGRFYAATGQLVIDR